MGVGDGDGDGCGGGDKLVKTAFSTSTNPEPCWLVVNPGKSSAVCCKCCCTWSGVNPGCVARTRAAAPVT